MSLDQTIGTVAPRAARGDGHPRRLHEYFEASVDRNPNSIAVVDGEMEVTYLELDRRANQLAHLMGDLPLRPDARVGILLRPSQLAYIALLGVLKHGTTFVPVDPMTPADRVAFIVDNAEIDLLLTTAELAADVEGICANVWCLDRLAQRLAGRPTYRPCPVDPDDLDPVCYIIYTSGSSGRPKGVAVAQSSIRNFIAVASAVYEVEARDRVYQGMSLSFDFSIEEIWPTFAVGATLVAGPSDSRHLGPELADFLEQNRVTVLYCVPTLLATLPRDLPLIRRLMVGGEACPDGLVRRWSRPGRRILNTYGPTEATVTATWAELLPEKPVAIGHPMPTYSVVLLDEDLKTVARGEVGEICIGGPGVAIGYVGLPEKTSERFVRHPLAPTNGDGRLYRTGDLARIAPGGELVYLGRADSEVKVRGHRVDLGEIENVLLECPDVESAAVTLVPGASSGELAAYVTLRRRDAPDAQRESEVLCHLQRQLRGRLPGYMVPSYLDVLIELPSMLSGKVDRPRLPPPKRRLVATSDTRVTPPATRLEEQLRDAWADTLRIPSHDLSVDANFFTDLGGHSLLAAAIISQLRERGLGRAPALRDIYLHPTIRSLATILDRTDASISCSSRHVDPPRHHSLHVTAAATAQAAFIFGLLLVCGLPVTFLARAAAGQPTVRWLLEFCVAIALIFLAVRWLLAPILVRFLAAAVRPGRYRLWSATYVRLWAVDAFLLMSPLGVLQGSPLMPAYLRLLGARVGSACHIGTSDVSLPTLLEIRDRTSIGYGVQLRPWTVDGGWVTVAPIRIGGSSFIGASSLLEPGAQVGDNVAVAHHSTIRAGQTVDDGERVAGSPAVAASSLNSAVEAMIAAPTGGNWTPGHLAFFLAWLGLLEIGLPVAIVAPSAVLVAIAYLTVGFVGGLVAAVLAGPVFVLTVCLAVATVRAAVLPRTPVGIQPACSQLGIRKWVSDRLLATSLAYTNTLYATLYTIPWLRLLGAKVGRGAEVSTAAHLDPDLLTLGEESFVADMASVGSADFCNGHMALQQTRVGSRAFVGNAAIVPSGTSLGPGSLVGVHTVPPSEDVREDTSWLGSPALYLPRRQDSGTFDVALTYEPTRRRRMERLAIEFVRITLPASLLASAAYLTLSAILWIAATWGVLRTALLLPLSLLLAGIGVVLVVAGLKWCIVGVYRPRIDPLWSRFVRRTELVTGLYEAAAVPALLGSLVGTPFLGPLLRLFGARVGRRAWIGTTYLTEFDLVTVGDDATIGRGVSLQTHLFEDRVMKMSRLRVGNRSSLGDRAIVLYDAVVGDSAALGALSLLMKGEHLPPATHWCGIPAQGVV